VLREWERRYWHAVWLAVLDLAQPEFHVLRPRSEIDVRFLYYATICRPFREIGAAMMRGSAGQKRIPAGFLSNFVMPFPNIEGQRLIVRFLDYSVRLINHLIRAKRQQIKLLNEQKQVIINQAVTRGLDAKRWDEAFRYRVAWGCA